MPTRTNRDDRYFTDTYQAMPLHGYTRMFERMLDHPNIKILLNTDYREIEGSILYDEMIYTGPIDEYFDYASASCRTARCEFQYETLERRQRPAGRGDQLSRTTTPYTRVTEFKHLTGQEHPKTTRRLRVSAGRGRSVLSRFRGRRTRRSTSKYQELADATPGVHFVGRLGTYKYYNMDQVVAQALTTFAKIAGVRRANASVMSAPTADIELWGGIECTINRVGDATVDQLERCGHDAAAGDLDAIAALGIRTLRYPVLWERIAPDGLDRARLALGRRARSRRSASSGFEPIVGLVHHGSGPSRPTCSIRRFAERLARLRRAPSRDALSVGRALHAGQRAADDGALRRPLRPLVSASPRRSRLRHGAR